MEGYHTNIIARCTGGSENCNFSMNWLDSGAGVEKTLNIMLKDCFETFDLELILIVSCLQARTQARIEGSRRASRARLEGPAHVSFFWSLFCHEWSTLEVSETVPFWHHFKILEVSGGLNGTNRKLSARSTIWEWSRSFRSSTKHEKKEYLETAWKDMRFFFNKKIKNISKQDCNWCIW